MAPRAEPPQERAVSDFEQRPPETPESARPADGDGRPTTVSVDPYEILGVRRDASQADIEAAYQRFSRYPDLWVGSGADREEKLNRIQAAHRLLSDPARRAAYDQAIAQGAQPRYGRPAPSGFRAAPIGARLAAALGVFLILSGVPFLYEHNYIWALALGGSGDVLVAVSARHFSRTARIVLDWIATIVGAVVIVIALKEWVVNPYRIPSSSMEPTLHCARPGPGCAAHFSDRVLACRICLDFSDPSRGDIIVFKTPPKAVQKCGEGGTFVKRLIGLPGETVSERDGFVYIDGRALKEPYIAQGHRDTQSGVWHVPKGQYFFMGDNRASSCDSREWGSVPRGNLIGTVFFVYWPPNRIGFK
jgi:signal peptidase I